MAGIPKVKIQFDADLDGLKKGSQDAEKEVEGFGDKVSAFGKKAAAAFAVAAAAAVAYAGKLAVDGVKAAMEDEKAQRILALTLENVTGATNDQIKAVEDYILKTALATGVTDDQLRPAFARLVRSTKDVEEAQKLMNLALDISSATGKPLEAISNALAKAYDGNTNALGRLGLGLDQSIIKSKDFDLVYNALRTSFAGFAANEANTFQGRLERLNVAFDEVKETIGFALLPILEKLLTFVTDHVFPIFQQFSETLSGKSGSITESLTSVVNYVRDFFEPIVKAVRDAFIAVGKTIQEKREDFKDILTTLKEVWDWIDRYLVPIFKTVLVTAVQGAVENIKTAINVLTPVVKFVVDAAKDSINGFIDLINLAIRAYNAFARVTGKNEINPIAKIGEVIPAGTNLGNRPFGVGMGTGTGTVTGGGGGGGAGGGGGGGAGAGSAAAAAAVDWGAAVLDATDLFAEALKNQSKSLQTLELLNPKIAQQVQAGTFQIPSDVPVLTALERERALLRAERASDINITVNGAVDPESTARQIVNILNDSNARGTLGGGGLYGLSVA